MSEDLAELPELPALPMGVDLSDVAEYLPPPDDTAPAEPVAPPPPAAKWRCAGGDRHYDDGRPWCTYRAPTRWRGRCPGCCCYRDCLPVRTYRANGTGPMLGKVQSMNLSAESLAKAPKQIRIPTGFPEIDAVLGGGVVLGTVALLKAEKGAGKSTLLLGACDRFANSKRSSLYVSGEMSLSMTAEYARRLGIQNPNVHLIADDEGVFVEDIETAVEDNKARLVVVDSAQSCTYGSAKSNLGEVATQNWCISYLVGLARRAKCAILVISHQNKSADFAGSERGLHDVDVLLSLDAVWAPDGKGGSYDTLIRSLSVVGKSRISSTLKQSYVELTDSGMVSPSRRVLAKLGLTPIE